MSLTRVRGSGLGGQSSIGISEMLGVGFGGIMGSFLLEAFLFGGRTGATGSAGGQI